MSTIDERYSPPTETRARLRTYDPRPYPRRRNAGGQRDTPLMGPANRGPGVPVMGAAIPGPHPNLMGGPDTGPRVSVMGTADRGSRLDVFGESDLAFVDWLFALPGTDG